MATSVPIFDFWAIHAVPSLALQPPTQPAIDKVADTVMPVPSVLSYAYINVSCDASRKDVKAKTPLKGGSTAATASGTS